MPDELRGPEASTEGLQKAPLAGTFDLRLRDRSVDDGPSLGFAFFAVLPRPFRVAGAPIGFGLAFFGRFELGSGPLDGVVEGSMFIDVCGAPGVRASKLAGHYRGTAEGTVVGTIGPDLVRLALAPEAIANGRVERKGLLDHSFALGGISGKRSKCAAFNGVSMA